MYPKIIAKQVNKIKNTDVQMLLKNIKTQTKIQKQRKEASDLIKEKAEIRNKKAEHNRFLSKQHKQEKLMQIQFKKQSRESRLLDKKIEKLINKALSQGEKDELFQNNFEDIPEIKVYSNHQNYIELTKNKFYQQNQNLLVNQYKLFGEKQENNTLTQRKYDGFNENKQDYDQFFGYKKGEENEKFNERDKVIMNEYRNYAVENNVELRLKQDKRQINLCYALNQNEVSNRIIDLDEKNTKLQNELQKEKNGSIQTKMIKY